MSFISKIYDTLNSVAQAINICKKPIHYQLDTEIDTGDYWIDGKKIYKMYKQTVAPNVTDTWTSVWDLTSININTIIDYNYLIFSTDSVWYKQYRDTKTFCISYINNSGIFLNFSYAALKQQPLLLSVTYTKN